MNPIEQLLLKKTEHLKGKFAQTEEEKSLTIWREQLKQQKEDNYRRLMLEIDDRYKVIYDILQHTGIESSLQTIRKFAIKEHMYRGREVNIPPTFIPRPRFPKNTGLYPEIDYARLVQSTASRFFPLRIGIGQVIDEAKIDTNNLFTVMREEQIRLNKHYLDDRYENLDGDHPGFDWESVLWWPVVASLGGYSSGDERSRSGGPYGPKCIKEGVRITVNPEFINIAQYNDFPGYKAEPLKRFSVTSGLDIEAINIALAEAFAGTLKGDS